MSQPSIEAPKARRDVVLVLWNQCDESEFDPIESDDESDLAPAGEDSEGAKEEAEAVGGATEPSSKAPAAAGDSDEAEAGASSSRIELQAEAVADALREHGLVAVSVDLEDDIDRIIDAIVLERPTIIFNLVDQYDGDATQHTAVAALLDLLGLPYTGSEPLALATCQDRARTRLILADADVPVPGYAIVRDLNAIPDTKRLRVPMIVTQAFDDLYDDEGYLRPIHSREELEGRLYELAREYDLPLMVEEFMGGRRLHALVTGNRVLDVLPICETEIDDEGGVSLSQLDSEVADRVRALARRAFRAVGARDLAQIDFHLAGDELVVTDVRATVDLGVGSPFAVASGACEGGFSGVVHEIARQAIRRARAIEELSVEGHEPAPEVAGDAGANEEPASAQPE